MNHLLLILKSITLLTLVLLCSCDQKRTQQDQVEAQTSHSPQEQKAPSGDAPVKKDQAEQSAGQGLLPFLSDPQALGRYLAIARDTVRGQKDSGNYYMSSTADATWDEVCGRVKGSRVSWLAPVVTVSKTHALIAYPEATETRRWKVYAQVVDVPYNMKLSKVLNPDSPYPFDSVEWSNFTGDKPMTTIHIYRRNDTNPQFYECLRLSDYPWLKSYVRYEEGEKVRAVRELLTWKYLPTTVKFDATITNVTFVETYHEPNRVFHSFVITLGEAAISQVAK